MIAFGRTSTVATCIALASCASGGTGSTANAGTSGAWTGSFRQSQVAATAVIGPATPGRGAAYGSVTIMPEEGAAKRYRVELSISAPMEPNTHLAWAVFSGPCGTPSPAVAGINEFPAIEIGSGGGGSVHMVMALSLDRRSTYHANVYWSSRASDVSNVMMCANLTITA